MMSMEMDFKGHLLKEERGYFGARVGDLLNSVSELGEDAHNMGNRHLVRLVESLVNQIRQVVRSRWSIQQRPYLQRLQRAGVALMKAVDEKADLPPVLQAVGADLQRIIAELGTPINQIGSGLAQN